MYSMRIHFAVYVCIYWTTLITGGVVKKPVDQTVTLSQSVRLNCQTNDPAASIRWTHTYIGGIRPYDVYSNGVVQSSYTGRFTVEGTSTGGFDLVIQNVQMSDAGTYVCIVDGERASASLSVNDGLENLLVVPMNTNAISGQDVVFNCSSVYLKNVWWKRIPIGSEKTEEIYYGRNGLVNGYRSERRHSVDADDVTGSYNLRIQKVTKNDAGKYICVDKSGIGKSAMAELIVFDSAPLCLSNLPPDGVIPDGMQHCGFEPDNVSMSCSVPYTGNIPPVLEWRSSIATENPLNFVYTRRSSSHVQVSLTMTTTRDTKIEHYFCHTMLLGRSYESCRKFSEQKYISNATTQLSESTSSSLISTCVADTKQRCDYSWVEHLGAQTEVVVAAGSVLNITRAGEYACKAECEIRGTKCTVYPIKLSVGQTYLAGFDNIRSITIIAIAVISGTIFLLLLLIVLLVVLLCVRKRIREEANLQRKQKDSEWFTLARAVEERIIVSFDVWQNHLYIISKDSNEISKYRSHPTFKFENSIVIPDMKAPVDIIGCDKMDCLYVSDSSSRCVWRVTSSPTKISPFIKDISSTFKLALFPDGKIILVNEKKGDKPSSIDIYDPASGSCVRTIHLTNMKDSISHAAYSIHDYFVVSFGGSIAKVDKSGNIVARYPTIDFPDFNTSLPWYIVMDREGRAYVAEFESGRIMVLDEKLEEINSLTIENLPVNEVVQKVVVYNNSLFIGLKSGKISVLHLSSAWQDVGETKKMNITDKKTLFKKKTEMVQMKNARMLPEKDRGTELEELRCLVSNLREENMKLRVLNSEEGINDRPVKVEFNNETSLI